uniref:Uncharacterized protein n=1 Tax=Arundo donax TaxID=35708 RepID=A0A0A9CGQ2_ARUDO
MDLIENLRRMYICCSKSALEHELLDTNTCSITGSVSRADCPKSELSVGTRRHPRTTCPSNFAIS